MSNSDEPSSSEQPRKLREKYSLSELIPIGPRSRREEEESAMHASTIETTIREPSRVLAATEKKYVHLRWLSTDEKTEDENSGFILSELSCTYNHGDDGSHIALVISGKEHGSQQLIPLPIDSKQNSFSPEQGNSPREASPPPYQPQVLLLEGNNEKGKRRVQVSVVEVDRDEEDEDEPFWTTSEWLNMCDFVNKTIAGMTQNRPSSDQGTETDKAGDYTHRVNRFDGPDEDSPLRRGTRMFSSRRSVASHNSEEAGKWSRAEMLYHSDRLRHISSCRRVSDQDLPAASLMISKLINDERNPDSERTISLETIAYARLDKLLVTIFTEEQKILRSSRPSPFFVKVFVDALALRSRWQDRFGSELERIDEVRLHHLKTCGAFHDVEVNPYSDDARTLFIVKRYKPTGTYTEMDTRYKTGDWWLNGACAYRDGITGSATEVLSECRYGVMTLTLLHGEEHSTENARVSIFAVSGSFDDIPRELIKLNSGKPIRVLRGSGLSSKWAPKGGLRYDGLYTMKTFGLVHHGDDIWTWNLTLQQLDKEPDLGTLVGIPSPSQLDDWTLCNEMVDATLASARADIASIETLRYRASTPEWEERLSWLSNTLSEATDISRATDGV